MKNKGKLILTEIFPSVHEICYLKYWFVLLSNPTHFLNFTLRIWKLKYVKNNNIASSSIWLWNMVSYIKGGIRATVAWEQENLQERGL